MMGQNNNFSDRHLRHSNNWRPLHNSDALKPSHWQFSCKYIQNQNRTCPFAQSNIFSILNTTLGVISNGETLLNDIITIYRDHLWTCTFGQKQLVPWKVNGFAAIVSCLHTKILPSGLRQRSYEQISRWLAQTYELLSCGHWWKVL